VTSSVINNFGAPPPPSGTALFYMANLPLAEDPPAFCNCGVTDTISSAQLSSSHTYSLYVYNFASDNQGCASLSKGVCPPWVANIGSPAANTHSITFPSPLNGASLYGLAIVWQFVQN
jgi:hypothetical protein